jgi:hypothetical protein
MLVLAWLEAQIPGARDGANHAVIMYSTLLIIHAVLGWGLGTFFSHLDLQKLHRKRTKMTPVVITGPVVSESNVDG